MGQMNNIVLTSDKNFSEARCNKSRVNIWAQLETVYHTGTTLKKNIFTSPKPFCLSKHKFMFKNYR